MAKIVPSGRLRRELDGVLAGVGEHDDPVEAVARLGARLILRQAREDEVTEFLGRERYARADDGGAIYRNGYEPRTVKTTSGAMELERPRIRSVSELDFESQVLGKGVARTHALEALIILGFVRGLSVHDVEALLEEALGEQVVGKSTVARICQDTRERYRAWCQRDLAAHDLVYRYLDAIYVKLRPDDAPAERVSGRVGAHAREFPATRDATASPAARPSLSVAPNRHAKSVMALSNELWLVLGRRPNPNGAASRMAPAPRSCHEGTAADTRWAAARHTVCKMVPRRIARSERMQAAPVPGDIKRLLHREVQKYASQQATPMWRGAEVRAEWSQQNLPAVERLAQRVLDLPDDDPRFAAVAEAYAGNEWRLGEPYSSNPALDGWLGTLGGAARGRAEQPGGFRQPLGRRHARSGTALEAILSAPPSACLRHAQPALRRR